MRNLLLILVCTFAARGADLAPLGFLSGCWEMTAGPLVIEECWLKPNQDLMLGSSRTSRQGKTVNYEQLTLVMAGGQIVYNARLQGKPATTPFTLVRGSATEAVFENLAHDFPQRIIYRRDGDKLIARIEDAKGTKGQDLPMRRAACQ